MSQTEVLSDGYDATYVLGDSAELLPGYIGRSEVIDAALDCFLNSRVAYVNRTADNLTTTYASNAKALQRIRLAILASHSNSTQNEVLIASFLLFLVEVSPYIRNH